MVEKVELYIIYYDFFLHENWPSLPPFKVKVLGKFEGAVEAIVGNVVPQHYSLTSDCLIKSHSKNRHS